MAHAMLDDVLNVVDEALITVDHHWRISYLNPPAERALGLSKRELIGQPLDSCVPELKNHEHWQQMIATLSHGQSVTCEAVSPITSRWVEVNASPIRSGWVLYLHDIHDRKQAQQALTQSERRFRALFDQAGVGMVQADPEGRLLAVNDRVCHMTGYTRQELLAMPDPFHTLTHPDDYKRVMNVLAHIRRGTHNMLHIEKRHVRKDGTTIWDQMTLSAIRDQADNHLCSVMAVFQEITDLKKTEQALAEARQRAEQHLAELRAVVGQMAEGVMILSPEGELVSMNEAGLKMHDVPSPDQAPRTVEQAEQLFLFMDPETEQPLPRQQWPVMRALNGQTLTDAEVLVENRQTGRRWIALCNARSVLDHQGNIRCVILTGRDITEKKNAERQLQQFNQVLEQRVAERTAEAERRAEQLQLLTAELSHAEQRERRRLAQLLHDDLQQLLVAARMRLNMSRHAQEQSVGEVSDLLQKAIETSRSLSTELAPPVLYDMGLAAALEWLGRWVRQQYALDVELEINATGEPDSDQVQVLMFEAVRELLLNVVKHAQTSAARVRLDHVDGRFRLQVQDFGKGFEPAVLQQSDRGESFGLFSMQQRIELVGGNVDIQSAPDQGTCITLELPGTLTQRSRSQRDADAVMLEAETEADADAQTDAVQPLPDRQAGPAASPAPSRISVLLIDDHEVVRRGIAELIRQTDDLELVGEAATGEQAIELAQQLQPDVAVMDISLPGISGIEATRRLTRKAPTTRVVGLSIHEEQDMAEAMRTAGGATCLSKAKPADALIRIIRRLAQPQNDGAHI